MTTIVGVWVDHREAILVKHSESGDETVRIQSGAERQLRRSSENPTGSHEPQNVPSDDVRNHKFTAELNQFYDAVIVSLGHPKSILIFGPGEAKGELRKRIDEKKIHTEEIAVETADRMTEAQVVARVRQYLASTIR